MGWESDGSLTDLVNDGELIANDAAREMADAAGARVTEATRALAPVNPLSATPGRLRDGYRQKPVTRTNDGVSEGYESGVESHYYVARFVETGTAEHSEEPSHHRAIAFRTVSGELVRAYIKRNPGIAGQHVVARALLATELGFEQIAQPALDRWAARQEAAARRR